MDDITFSLSVRDIMCSAPNVFDASITHIAIEMCPGYSRGLRAKLPPSAPITRRPRTPSSLRFWEGNGSLHGLKFHFQFPVVSKHATNDSANASMSLPGPGPVFSVEGLEAQRKSVSTNGAFLRLESLRIDAYGKAADERHQEMTHASINIRGCSAGSNSVNLLSSELYENAATTKSDEQGTDNGQHVQSVENIASIVDTKPEALLWIEDVTAAADVNCSKRNATRVDIAGNGGVLAMEPVGLVAFVREVDKFVANYVEKKTESLNNTFETDSISSFATTVSSSSIQSADEDPSSVRIVIDMRYWTIIALGNGPVGDGNTLAIVASCDKLDIPQIDFFSAMNTRIAGSMTNFVLTHWTPDVTTTSMTCAEATFDIRRGIEDGKYISLRKAIIEWDLDVQSGLYSLPGIFSELKKLKNRSQSLGDVLESDGDVLAQQSFTRDLYASMSESEKRSRRDTRHARMMSKLSSWHLAGTDVKVYASFPDGPRMGLSAANIPSFPLDTKAFVGHHVVLTMQEWKCAYASELSVESPLHGMKRGVDKRTIEIDAQDLRIVLYYELQFGYLLQDWLLRLRCALRISRDARLRRRGIPPQQIDKKPLPDISFISSNVEIYFEDHPLGGFLTTMLPLMQDETRERHLRADLMNTRIQQLSTIARAEIAGTSIRCMEALREKDSSIWIERVKKLKQSSRGLNVANGYLPLLPAAPVSTFVATTLCFSITMDDLVRQKGSRESIRRLKMLDDYELGIKKYNKTRHYHSDAWNSIGFRTVDFEATGVTLRFRDYDVPFLVIDRMYFRNTTMGQAVQATLPPYVAETTVGIGKRRQVKLVKGLGPTKTYADIHLVIETFQVGFNPSFFGAISEFGRGVSRFFSGGKNPSPKIPWFDSLRVNMHGRMRLTAKKFKGLLTSSTSPYSKTKHYAEIEVDNFEMLTSRLEATAEDPFPICFKFSEWHIRPSTFDEARKSEIVFDFVRVGFNPIISTLSGDPQDHYFVPFPPKEEVALGGPGIGKGTYTHQFVDKPILPQDNGFGNYTVWTTSLHDIPNFDSFKNFKTNSMILGLDIHVRHRKLQPLRAAAGTEDNSKRRYLFSLKSPGGASVMYSDAISSLTKVVKILIRRPISCRFAPRRLGPQRKPPSTTGLSSTLRGLHVCLDAKDLNVVLHNNLEPGHGLFISIKSLTGELRKRTDISRTANGSIKRTSKLTRKRFNILDMYAGIRVPCLDLAVDDDDTGKLLTIDKISLSDDLRDEANYFASPSSRGQRQTPSSGFGSDDLNESPFYTFSATHYFQKGNKLDKVLHDKRLLVDRVRLIWSPVRRASVFAWPDAFKEKTFSMKTPRTKTADEIDNRNQSQSAGKFSNVYNRGSDSDQLSGANGTLPRMTVSDSMGDTGEEVPPLNLSQAAKPQSMSLNSMMLSDNTESSEAKEIGSSTKRMVSLPKTNPATNPISPAMLAMSRSTASVKRKYGGNLVDLLTPFMSKPSQPKSAPEENSLPQKDALGGVLEILRTKPKFAVYINDCEVAFGSPETSGIVFLTSNAVRIGIIDKKLQKHMQLGQKNERWADREYRFHLNSANLYTRCRSLGDFDFSPKDWVTKEEVTRNALSLVTTKPICMDLMYISSSSVPRENADEEEEDHTLRPSLLFINIPDISISTNTDEFHAAVDVVRKVLMQSMRSSELVNDELAKMRYNLQLAGGNISTEELDEYMLRLNNITRQFLYAGDTFQPHLVDALLLPDEETFADNLLRYKAKAKAVATFMRQDRRPRSKDILYPTMYVSYSFDKLSWVLREKQKEYNKEDPFVEISLEDLVCRHIFYVGRGSSTEMTFANIGAQNKMRSSYFEGILQPATTGNNTRKATRIKASDGKSVAFRWYSTQEDRVGGIPVYETLTIQVAPMTAAVTRRLYSSVYEFIFSKGNGSSKEDDAVKNAGRPCYSIDRNDPSFRSDALEGVSASGAESRTSMDSTATARKSANSSQTISEFDVGSKMDDVKQMAKRGESSILFKYVFIDALELTASYKYKETQARSLLDFFDLFVTTPSYSYSSQVWTWKAFASQIRKDLLMTFARRGVSNLAKIKLLPGYSRAKRKLVQGADSFRDSIYSRLPSAGVSTEEMDEEDRTEMNGSEADLEEMSDGNDLETGSEMEEDNCDTAIEDAAADISDEDSARRKKVLRLLYGNKAGSSDGRSSSAVRLNRPGGSGAGSESSGDSIIRRPAFVSGVKPPRVPQNRNRTTAASSRGSAEEEIGTHGWLSKIRRKYHDHR